MPRVTKKKEIPEARVEQAAVPGRMLSVDALRGFDMFWLVGGTGLALAIAKLCPSPIRDVLLPQLDHRAWEGCTFFDTIFPLFVFIVGLSVPFSLERVRNSAGPLAVYWRILRRFVLLFALGLFYYGGLTRAWPDVRLLGVLQRLALCYLAAALLYYHVGLRNLIVTFVGILFAYWVLLNLVPVPGTHALGCAEASNWPRYIDEQLLPGKKYCGTWDENGILSTFPAIATCLMGVLSAILLRNPQVAPPKKAALLIGAGFALAIVGWLWGFQFPVVKKLWTSSYVLLTGGYSVALLGGFYLVMDVWHFQRWAVPLLWIGVNPLTIYLARNIVDFNLFAERFTGGSVAVAVGEDYAYLMKTTLSLFFSMIFVWYLHKRKIFLRV